MDIADNAKVFDILFAERIAVHPWIFALFTVCPSLIHESEAGVNPLANKLITIGAIITCLSIENITLIDFFAMYVEQSGKLTYGVGIDCIGCVSLWVVYLTSI